ncbi:hypothetical protein OWT79_04315 [Bacteroides fragilis]|nr:hypothetical protein [Bacteroides fragilis]
MAPGRGSSGTDRASGEQKRRLRPGRWRHGKWASLRATSRTVLYPFIHGCLSVFEKLTEVDWWAI